MHFYHALFGAVLADSTGVLARRKPAPLTGIDTNYLYDWFSGKLGF
jgi:hypothetical protein